MFLQVSVHGGDPRGLRPPWTETPQTETPLDSDSPWTEIPLDRDIPVQSPPPRDTGTPFCTETPLDRDPLTETPLLECILVYVLGYLTIMKYISYWTD